MSGYWRSSAGSDLRTSLETVTSLASACFWMLSVTPGRPFCDDEMRGTAVDAVTVATSEMRLSALGTAQLCNAPTKEDVAVPLPLPNELAPPDGWAPAAADALAPVDADPATDCGLMGCETGTVALAFADD